MDLLMNGLLTVATLFAGGYCWVLARRVRDLKSLDKGLGGAIVTLTRQIELARATLEEARGASKSTRDELQQLVARADAAAGQLRLLLAAAPASAAPAAPAPPAVAAEPPVRAEPAPRLKAGALMSMLAGAEPEAGASAAPDVPKPRALLPIENPLRRFRPDAPGAAASEDDILEALRALAGAER
jgi:hypothetical protein